MSEDLIMPADGNMGGASTPIPEGNIKEGTGVEIVLSQVDSETDKNGELYARIHAHYVNDDSAKGQIYCSLHRADGLAKLVDIVCLSGVAERMKKNGSMKKDPLKGIPASVLKSSKFHEQLNISLPGCRVLASVTHRAKEFPDKETGEMVKYTESVIGRIAAIGRVENKSVTLGTAINSTNIPGSASVPEKPVSSDEDWL